MARFDVSEQDGATSSVASSGSGGVVLFMVSAEMDAVLERVAKKRGCEKAKVLIDAVMMLERSEG